MVDMVDMEMVDMDQLADLSRTFGLVLYLSIFLDGKKTTAVLVVTKCWLMGRGLKLGDWGGRLTAQLTHSYAVSFKPASHFLGALATLVGQHQQQVKEVRSLLQVTQEIVFWISARGSLLTSVFLPI